MTVPTIPTVVTRAGLQPTPPAVLRDQLLADVAAQVPGYTANLPASLVEDISSTDVAALALMDAARVELVNSLTPYGANEFILNQLGQIYGVTPGVGSNTSVYVVFSGTVGFVIAQGFTVTDGTYQYVVQNGGVIESGGDSEPLFCLATQAGTWAVPANTVTSPSEWVERCAARLGELVQDDGVSAEDLRAVAAAMAEEPIYAALEPEVAAELHARLEA